jgi:hypothetical protein
MKVHGSDDEFIDENKERNGFFFLVTGWIRTNE